ncbi:MAG: sigma-54-dependent Fis family transcriptional regulator [Candidatus Cloacimonadota bacterium]|nr:MAG: sigma-54-dependent Fis family transcriptional regulator [Candidatus Cloacimonadota bacterium]
MAKIRRYEYQKGNEKVKSNNKSSKKENISILVVDDDEYILDSFSQLIELKGYTSFAAENGKKALAILSKNKIDVIIADMKMPEMDGMQLLKSVKEKHPEINVIIITGYGSIDDAVEAMKRGASDYILKPFSPDEIILKIVNVCKKKKRQVKIEEITGGKSHLPKIVAETDTMKEVLNDVKIVAPTNANVLITGETGVGKDIIARLIHINSKRSNQPFIRMNCVELNEGVIESELFGHKKGSFTGAVSEKIGRLELADKGTLFLDEVGDIPLSTQKKLLRVLEHMEFERVGGTETIRIDVRVIAATNKNLSRAVKKKEFRRDFFYRLNTVVINIPPLRERNDDILPLADHFLTRFTEGEKRIKFTKEVKNMLLAYSWPGNVRELKSTVERAVIFSKGGDIDLERLFSEKDSLDDVEGTFTIECPTLILDDVEKSLLLKVLSNARWNIQQSARVLKISRTTLYEKIRKYELDSFRDEDNNPESLNKFS